MVARNFSLQDVPYSRLLQVPDDDREFLTLDDLKPHQLTELGVTGHHHQLTTISQQQQQPQHHHVSQSNQQVVSSNSAPHTSYGQQHQQNIYYDLNTQQTTM